MGLPILSAEEVYRSSALDGLRPDPLLTISEWADAYRKLSQRASSEPGSWRTDRTPYLREIMDCLSPSSPIERVVLMKGAQLGGTECGNNWVGYVMHKSPGPMMLVQPTVELAKRNSKQRIDPLIEESPELSAIVKSPRARDSGNTVLSKEFPGGVLVMTGANSAVGLRSMAVRYLFLDEVDGYPGDVEGEGDPINIALARTRTFARRKVLMVSTPLVANRSRIEAAYLESDQRRYWVPCPHCGEFQVLKFDRLRWPKGEPEKAALMCVGCEQPIKNHHKTAMLRAGEWRAEGTGDGRTRGYHLSSMYSPVGWYSWERIAEDWEKAQGDPARLRSFVNLALGESWKERGEAPDWEVLMGRKEDAYRMGQVPQGVVFLTAGFDVQKTWLEGYVWGWGRDRQRWLIDHLRVEHSPFEAAAWKELSALIARTYRHPSGCDLSLVRVGIDSSFATMEVYAWARQEGSPRVMALDPRTRGPVLVGMPSMVDFKIGSRVLRRGAKIWPVNVSMAKHELYGLLGKDRPSDGEAYPPGWLHFPRDVDDEFFRQLTAESLQTHIRKGYRITEWVKDEGRRNEALDCANYARAAAAAFGLDKNQTNERWWAALEQFVSSEEKTTLPKKVLDEPIAIRGNFESASRAGSWIPGRNWFDR